MRTTEWQKEGFLLVIRSRCQAAEHTDLVPYGVAASVLGLSGEGHAAHQLGAGQRRDAVVVHGQDAELVVPRRRQVAQQEVLVVGRDHPGERRERERQRDIDIENNSSLALNGNK